MGYVSGSNHSTDTTPDAWDVVVNKSDVVLGPCPFDTYSPMTANIIRASTMSGAR